MSAALPFAPHSLTVAGLACARGGAPVFEGVGFSLSPGEAIALTGANGSGKSSLLRIVGGLIKPAAGEAVLSAGGAPADLALASHYIGHALALEDSGSVLANVRFAARLLGGNAGPAADFIARVGLSALSHAPVRQLSAGERKRLALARLLATPRPLWLLDEPTAALDSAGSALLGELAGAHLAAGGLILCATHGGLPFPVKARLNLGVGAGR